MSTPQDDDNPTIIGPTFSQVDIDALYVMKSQSEDFSLDNEQAAEVPPETGMDLQQPSPAVSFATEAESNSFDDTTEHTTEAEVVPVDRDCSSHLKESQASNKSTEGDYCNSGSNCSSAEATARTGLETMDSTNDNVLGDLDGSIDHGYDVDHRDQDDIIPPPSGIYTASKKPLAEPEEDQPPPSKLTRFARGINQKWAHVTNKGREFMLKGVVNTAVTAAKYPKLTILLVSIISIALIVGGAYTNFEVRLDNDYLFTPTDSEVVEYKRYLADTSIYEDLDEVPSRRRDLRQARTLAKLRQQRQLVTIRVFDEDDADTYNGSHSTLIYDSSLANTNTTSTVSAAFETEGSSDSEEDEDEKKEMKKKTYTRGRGHLFPFLVHADTENIFTIEGIHKMFDVLDYLRALPMYKKVCAEGGTKGWHNFYGEKTCEIKAITRLWNHNRTLFEEVIKTEEDLFDAADVIFYPDGGYVDLPFILAQYDEDEHGRPVRGEAFYAYVYLKKVYAFDSLIDSMLELRADWLADDSHHLHLEFTFPTSFEKEVMRAITGDLPLIPTVFLVMCVFTCLVFFKCHKVYSRSLLGVGAVVTILLSLLSGYGLLFMTGVPMTVMTNLLIFVIFGIGLDDTFIITGAYFRTGHQGDPVGRVKSTMEAVGSSILLTTVTTSAAFLLGCSSTILPIRWLCLYAFPAIMIDFLYQITFFIVLDEQRIQRNRMDCCICFSVPSDEQTCDDGSTREEDEGTCPRTPESGNSLHKEASLRVTEPESRGQQQQQQQSTTSDPFKSDHIADRFMRWYATRLMHPVVKVFVVIGFAAFAVVCAVNTGKLRQQFNFKDLLPSDSYVTSFIMNVEYYSDRAIAVRVNFRFVDQADEEVRNQMEKFVADLVEDVDALNEPAPLFWVRELRTAVAADPSLQGLPFYEQLRILLKNPTVKDAVGKDIKFREDGTILWSTCRLYVTDLDMEDVRDQIDFMGQQREVTEAQPVNQGKDLMRFFTYDPLYHIFAFYEVAAGQLAATTISSVVAVCVIAFLLIPHWSAVPIIFPLISVLYIDMLGILQMFGYSINVVTYIILVLSIGLLVDFIMHILLRYYESECDTREEKVKDALGTMGASILVGGLSTFLGVTPLIFSASEIFSTVCLAFLAMVSLGVTHGLILLPVILSYCGTEKVVHHRKRLSLVQITTALSE